MTAVVRRFGFRLASSEPETYEERGRMVTVLRWEHGSAPAEESRG
jgi:hypothetical protein